MFVTFIIIIFVWPFLKLQLYRDTRAYILDLASMLLFQITHFFGPELEPPLFIPRS